MPIHLQFTFTFRDYVDAQLLHARRGLWPRLNLALAYTLIPLIGIVGLLTSYLMVTTKSWGFLAFELPLGVFLLCYPLYLHLRWKRCYLRTRTGEGDHEIDFDEAMIRVTAATMRSEIQWQGVRSFSENQKIFLLYLAPAKFLPIPKRICSPQQTEELRSLFTREIGAIHP
jgi:hypothetical protein